MEQSLFEKYGGFATIHKVVEHFYDGVLDNDTLSPYFEDVDMSMLIDHQTRFFSSAMGGPASFDDGHLEKAHQGRGITEESWDAVVGVLLDTLNAFNVEEGDIQAIVGAVGSKKFLIVQQ
ncbi:MAG: group 1 truncated hemoglobin [Pseudomonadota bacterium]|jgi:hemoglobin|nr:group 1 truncated hemoglobin [Gammaproteobacteria bacterium]